MRKIPFLVIMIIGLIVIPFTGCSPDKSSKGQFKLATLTPMTHTYNQGSLKFAELIKSRTGGRIEITVFPDGQLGKGEREILEAVQQGTIDIYVGSTGPIGGFSPAMSILDIPFIFTGYSHADKVLDGTIGRQLMDELERSGFKALAFWENGFRNLTNSRRIVKTPEDAKGLKIRTMENKIHIAAWKSIGVNPTPMAWGEVYGALQQKTIDGEENPVAIIHSSKLNEVQKYLSLTQHVYSPALVIVSLKKWQAMSPEDQKIFMETAREVAAFQRKLGRDNEERQVAELMARGMTVTKNIDKESWRRAMSPAIEEFAGLFGRDKIDAIMNTK